MVAPILYALGLIAAPSSAAQTTPFEFFGTYVSQLATFEQLRASAEQEVQESAGDSLKISMGCIHSGTRYDLEASSAASMMDGMHLSGHFGNEDFQQLPHQIAEIYRLRQAFMRKITGICTAFAEGPKAGVDYKTLAAQMPKLRASIEDLDQTLMVSGVLAFSTLISDREDSQGHASHLIIGCLQKQELLNQLKRDFGAKLDKKDVSAGVKQAQIFRQKLMEFKCAEQPR